MTVVKSYSLGLNSITALKRLFLEFCGPPFNFWNSGVLVLLDLSVVWDYFNPAPAEFLIITARSRCLSLSQYFHPTLPAPTDPFTDILYDCIRLYSGLTHFSQRKGKRRRQDNLMELVHHWKHLLFCPAEAVCKAAIIRPNNRVPVCDTGARCVCTQSRKRMAWL